MRADNAKPEQAWKTRIYPVPTPSRRAFQLKAAFRGIQQWSRAGGSKQPATVMVPALYNIMPAETVPLGWLNEIDALVAIRHRMVSASKITGWDLFTFHTLYNPDHFYDTTIGAVRDTWVKEGHLSAAMIRETRRQFPQPYAYHRIDARLVETLVLQSALLDWLRRRASDLPLRFQFIGTGLLSALVCAGSLSFEAAVRLSMRVGGKWNDSLRTAVRNNTEEQTGWACFQRVRRLIEGREPLSLGMDPADLPRVEAPARPFWYSPSTHEQPALVTTSQEVLSALETLNLGSWSSAAAPAVTTDEPFRGWLISSLHPMARRCRWSASNYLLGTPECVSLFLDQVATLGRGPVFEADPKPAHSRFRLSRMKVTGP